MRIWPYCSTGYLANTRGSLRDLEILEMWYCNIFCCHQMWLSLTPRAFQYIASLHIFFPVPSNISADETWWWEGNPHGEEWPCRRLSSMTKIQMGEHRQVEIGGWFAVELCAACSCCHVIYSVPVRLLPLPVVSIFPDYLAERINVIHRQHERRRESFMEMSGSARQALASDTCQQSRFCTSAQKPLVGSSVRGSWFPVDFLVIKRHLLLPLTCGLSIIKPN